MTAFYNDLSSENDATVARNTYGISEPPGRVGRLSRNVTQLPR